MPCCPFGSSGRSCCTAFHRKYLNPMIEHLHVAVIGDNFVGTQLFEDALQRHVRPLVRELTVARLHVPWPDVPLVADAEVKEYLGDPAEVAGVGQGRAGAGDACRSGHAGRDRRRHGPAHHRLLPRRPRQRQRGGRHRPRHPRRQCTRPQLAGRGRIHHWPDPGRVSRHRPRPRRPQPRASGWATSIATTAPAASCAARPSAWSASAPWRSCSCPISSPLACA